MELKTAPTWWINPATWLRNKALRACVSSTSQ